MRPESNELDALVRELHRQGTAWLPSGLGSRLDWGAPLRQRCEPLSCAELRGIVEHNPGDFTISVRAGTPLVEVQEALAHHRQWLALDLPWGSATTATSTGSIGGLVARGLSGGYRQRHLGVRDQLIGLQLLRADGVRARAGGRVVKNVAGYDLMRLFCGSWGSLGLITEVTLRTQPLPPVRRGLLLQGSLAELAALSRWLLHSCLTPERIDLWSAALAAAAGLEAQALLLIGLASVEAGSLADQIATIRQRWPGASQELEAEAMAPLLARSRGEGGSAESTDWLLRLGVPADRAWDLLAGRDLEGLALDLSAGSGIGLAWPLPAGPVASACLDAGRIAALREHCRQLGGWLTLLRQPAGSNLPAWQDVPSRPLIEAVKRQFDPKLQLAPGRLPGVAAGLQASGSTR
jgi:glycolate oxidase FAD binding subunit